MCHNQYYRWMRGHLFERRRGQRRKYGFFYLQILKTKKHIWNHKLHNHKQTIYIARHFGIWRGLSDYCCPTLKASQMQVYQTVIKECLIRSCSLQNSTQIILSVITVQVLLLGKEHLAPFCSFSVVLLNKKKFISNIIYYDKHSLTFSHPFQLILHSFEEVQFS